MAILKFLCQPLRVPQNREYAFIDNPYSAMEGRAKVQYGVG